MTSACDHLRYSVTIAATGFLLMAAPFGESVPTGPGTCKPPPAFRSCAVCRRVIVQGPFCGFGVSGFDRFFGAVKPDMPPATLRHTRGFAEVARDRPDDPRSRPFFFLLLFLFGLFGSPSPLHPSLAL